MKKQNLMCIVGSIDRLRQLNEDKYPSTHHLGETLDGKYILMPNPMFNELHVSNNLIMNSDDSCSITLTIKELKSLFTNYKYN